MSLYYNGQLLTDETKTLLQLGILQDDIVLVRLNAPPTHGGTGMQDRIEMIRQQILQDPIIRQQITTSNPMLGRVLQDPEQFRRVFMELERTQATSRAPPNPDAFADPFDVEAQKRIEAEIRRANIAENLENAMEYNPESFGRVVMLYVDMTVNGVPVKAFVDSGAQATIMSPQLAEKCNIMHLLDERFAGVARGVGTAKILGRIHSAPIQVGKTFLPCSFTIMENKGVEFLFGLDMLRRHQACIDLVKNVLRIAEQEVPFLQEHEIPAADRFEEQGQESPSAPVPSAPVPPVPAPAPAANAPASAPIAGQPAGPAFPESSIKVLTDLGVSREEAIGALEACGGNADLAANMLFQ